jgi:hypothetical protein
VQRGCRKQEIHSTRWIGNVNVKRPLTYSGYCCLGLFGGVSTEITIENDRHVTIIFFYILHSPLLFIAPCAAMLPSPLREGGIKSAKLGTKLIGT